MPVILTANSSTISNTLQVPADGVDPVAQSSVDPAFQNVLNNTYYIGKSIVYEKPTLYMTSINGTTVVVSPFSGLWVSSTNPTETWVYLNNSSSANLTAANLDVGGAFSASTAYYVYAKTSVTPFVSTFEISATAPDATLTFKGSDISRRYIGSFMVDASSVIVPFIKADSVYTIATLPTNASDSTSTTSTKTFSLFSYLPSTTSTVRLGIDLSSNSGVAAPTATSTAVLKIGVASTAGTYSILGPELFLDLYTSEYNSIFTECTVPWRASMSSLLTVGGSGGTVDYAAWLNGYTE